MTDAERRSRLQCELYPAYGRGNYTFVVICAWYRGKLLLSRHRERTTWETQGGHIEPGETPVDAARRELYEECGARDFDLTPVCDYFGYDEFGSAWGVAFRAEIRELGVLPESEMAETALFDALPENLTYPMVTPKLFEAAQGGTYGNPTGMVSGKTGNADSGDLCGYGAV